MKVQTDLKRLFILVGLLLLISSQAATATGGQVIGFSFDADDNMFNLPTKVMIFHKDSGKEMGVTTAEFALIREDIGKPGTKWEGYEIRQDRKTGSLRFFSDEIGDGINHFLEDLKSAMRENEKGWKASSFDEFVVAMESPRTAKETTIITARGHNPETIHEALSYLKSLGIIKNVLAVDNIWTVSSPTFVQRFEKVFGIAAPEGSASSPSARKAAVMQQILDGISKRKLSKDAPLVVTPNGGRKGRYHLWGFSDDDFGNFEKAAKVIQEGLDKGHWRNIKITLFFTGTNHEKEKPHAVVLRAKKEPRAILLKEEIEWQKILEACQKTRKQPLRASTDLSLESLIQECGSNLFAPAALETSKSPAKK